MKNSLEHAIKHIGGCSLYNKWISKTQYLTEAKTVYTELVCLLEVEKYNGHYINNVTLICSGYYGGFQVFGVLNDYKNGAWQVYECAIKHPTNAVKLFDNTFFPSIDVTSIKDLFENLERLHKGARLTGIYANIPSNMAQALLEMQIDKYIESFNQILNTI